MTIRTRQSSWPSASAPDFVEPALACRAWNLDRSTMTLRSITRLTPWPKEVPIRAECQDLEAQGWLARAGRHPAPDGGCDCGVWGLAFPQRLMEQVYTYPSYVFGVVSLWGKVIFGTEGWRAEFARPVALMDLLPPTELADWCRVKHGDVPVTTDSLRAVAAHYGIPVIQNWPTLSEPVLASERERGSTRPCDLG